MSQQARLEVLGALPLPESHAGVRGDSQREEDDSVEADKFTDDEEEPPVVQDESQLHLGEQILYYWNKRRIKLITPLGVAGWYCSPDAEI